MSMAEAVKRDYSLASAAEEQAVAAGLAEAEWYRSPVDPARLSELARRSDGRSALHFGLYLTLLVGSGVWAYLSLWSWWSIPALFVYGTLYGSSADPRWHECGHGTAFKTDWINNAIYFPASFMLLRDATLWRWSHVRHHSDTIVVARDPEIILPRPPQAGDWVPNLFNLKGGPQAMARTVRHAMGRIADADRSFLPEREQHKIVREGRIYVVLWLALIVWCLVAWTPIPLLFFVGPSFYGAWLVLLFGTTQHLGLREDVLDHRLNTRTVYMNPVARFLYWNMNYHTEHHMYPTIPWHALPKLHDEIKHDLPPASPSILAAYRELVPALRKQHNDPSYEIDRPLPSPSEPGQRSFGLSVDVKTFEPGGTDGSWVDIGAGDELAPDEVARVDVGEQTFAVYRLGDRILATDGICTHSRRVHLAGGLVINGQIECPKHNGRFDIASGQPTRAPVCDALQTHVVEVRNGRVMLQIADEQTETNGG